MTSKPKTAIEQLRDEALPAYSGSLLAALLELADKVEQLQEDINSQHSFIKDSIIIQTLTDRITALEDNAAPSQPTEGIKIYWEGQLLIHDPTLNPPFTVDRTGCVYRGDRGIPSNAAPSSVDLASVIKTLQIVFTETDDDGAGAMFEWEDQLERKQYCVALKAAIRILEEHARKKGGHHDK